VADAHRRAERRDHAVPEQPAAGSRGRLAWATSPSGEDLTYPRAVPLLVPATKEDLFADPIGKIVAGASFAYFCARPDLYGFALWGRATEESMAKLVALLEVELGAAIVPHVSLVDARAVDGVDAGAFARLSAYVRRNFARLGEVVTRLAVLHPVGFAGATVSGFFQVEKAPYPVGFFSSVEEATAWLGVADGARVLDEITAHVLSLRGGGRSSAELRALLAGRPAELTLATAAKALGVSARSLQRRLQDEGTTFAREQAAARIRTAQSLLLDTDASLTQIALDAGWATLAHFSTAFREATGETPSAWRKRRREGH
jgi:AraC-like DNA-binding protein